MVIEAGEENAVPWMAPVDADESLVMSLGPTTKLHHAGGMNACFVDGSVVFLKANTPAEVRRALMSISGNDNEAPKSGNQLELVPIRGDRHCERSVRIDFNEPAYPAAMVPLGLAADRARRTRIFVLSTRVTRKP